MKRTIPLIPRVFVSKAEERMGIVASMMDQTAIYRSVKIVSFICLSNMKTVKTIIFWVTTLVLFVSNFIGLFIDNDFGKSVKIYFREVPLYMKICLVLIFLSLLWWSFPYKKSFKR